MKFSTATTAMGLLSLTHLVAAQPHRVRHAHKHAKKDIAIVEVVDTVYVKEKDVKAVVMVDAKGVAFTTVTEGMLGQYEAWSTQHGSPTLVLVSPASTTAPLPTPTTFATVPSVAPSVETSSSSVEVIPSPIEVSSSSVQSVASVPTSPVVPTVAVAETPAPVAASAPVDTPAPVATSAPAVQAAAAPVETSSSPSPEPTTQSSSEAAEPVADAGSVNSPVQIAAVATATAASAAGTSGSGSGYGFSYSPYNADGTCKTQSQVNADFAKIGDGYSIVRTYGVDCDQVATVLSAAKSKGLKMFAGIFDISDLAGAVKTISAAANGDWSSFDTISVGNELVNNGANPATVIAAVKTIRGLLKSAGYTGKVTTVDTLVAARANPGLCDASDVCTVNCHPFFDGKVTADESGDFLKAQISTLQDVLANKNQEIVITETGWPWQGSSNGAAVPSTANQVAALASIKSTFASKPSSVILFTVFNDMWKKNSASQFGAEQFWGFLGDSPSG